MNTKEDLDNEIQNSEAYQIYGRIMYLREVFAIFSDNYDEMKAFLEKLQKQEVYIRLIPIERHRDMQHVLRHVTRRLLNYVTSAMMLVDHTREVTSKHYSGTDFERKYNLKKTVFIDSPLHRFIQDLRNYALHYRLPMAGWNFVVRRERLDQPFDGSISFVLIRDQLSNWENWSPKAREYLNSADKEIDISELTNSYFQLVYSFHAWMHSELSAEHSNELAWFDEKIAELKQMRDM